MHSQISFKKKIALTLFQRYKKNTTKVHELNYILWECTLRCNLNCLHCGSDCKKDTSVKDMPVADFLSAIDTLSEIVNPNKTIVVFTGGEALLRKDLETCGEELYKRGFPWGLVTNGFLLNASRLNSLLNAGLRSVTVSLDGLEKSHTWLRGNKGSYALALSAIKLLPQVPHLEYDVVTCVNQKNINELDRLRDLLIDTGIKRWRLFTIFPIGRAKDNDDLQLSPSQFRELFEFIKNNRQSKGIDLSYGCEGFLGGYEGEVRDNFFFCRAGINIASVLADGSISACPNLRNNFIQGNIYKDSLAEVWQKRFSKFRNREWTKTGPCEQCDYFKYCEGNGLHLRDEQTGELLFCHQQKLTS